MRRLVILLIFAVLTGVVLGFMDVELDLWDIFFFVFIPVFAFLSFNYLYIMFLTQNIKFVDRFIHNKKNHPYYALLIVMVNGDVEVAENELNRIKSVFYEQVRVSAQTWIFMEKGYIEEAKRTAEKIKNKNARNHYLANIALVEENWEVFDQAKSMVKHPGLRYALEAELAFNKGDMEQAQKLGDLAISASRGLQKYILVKSLERQSKNPNRKTFF